MYHEARGAAMDTFINSIFEGGSTPEIAAQASFTVAQLEQEASRVPVF